MPRRGTLLSAEEQAQIRALKDIGLSGREVARRTGRSHGCVGRYLQNPDNYRSTSVSGRPRALSEQDRRRIARLSSNSSHSVNQIRAQTGVSASRATVWRSIRSNAHISRQSMQKAPRLTARHKKERLEFARRNMDAQWEKVRILV